MFGLFLIFCILFSIITYSMSVQATHDAISDNSDNSNTTPTDDDCQGEPNMQMICSLHVDPVFGCDGRIYTNECHATAQGIKRTRPTTDHEATWYRLKYQNQI